MASANIIVVDQQASWRSFARAALESVGYAVTPMTNYDRLLNREFDETNSPDLVVLGCAGIGPDESELISHLHSFGVKTVVFATSTPPKLMRLLFLRGVSDVVDRSYSKGEIRSVVREIIGRPLRREVSTHTMALFQER